MSDNIISRLRAQAKLETQAPMMIRSDSICWEAADEIENLQAKIRIAEAALEELQARDDFLMKVLGMSPEDVKELLQMLEEKRKEK